MSKISTIYENIRTIVSTTLDSEYRELANAFDLEDNDELNLVKGWSVVPGPGDNTHRLICGKQSHLQQFAIPLTRLLTATDHDITAKNTIIKDLLEDQQKIAMAFEQDPQLGNTTATNIHVGHSAVEYLQGDNDKFLLLVIAVSTEYFENIT